jgi:hypothetical protein
MAQGDPQLLSPDLDQGEHIAAVRDEQRSVRRRSHDPTTAAAARIQASSPGPIQLISKRIDLKVLI